MAENIQNPKAHPADPQILSSLRGYAGATRRIDFGESLDGLIKFVEPKMPRRLLIL